VMQTAEDGVKIGARTALDAHTPRSLRKLTRAMHDLQNGKLAVAKSVT
jgi:hypothetical protein